MALLGLVAAAVVSGCTSAHPRAGAGQPPPPAKAKASPGPVRRATQARALPGMPALLDPHNVYAADAAGALRPVVRADPALVYVPNSKSNTVEVIDQRTLKVINTFAVGHEPQHVVPSYDLATLYVAADYVPAGGGRGTGSLTPIDPRTGRPGRPIPVEDPYNLYFTPDGKYSIVMAEARREIIFSDPHTMKPRHVLSVPGCNGVNHADFSTDGRYFIATCEFSGRLIKVDVETQQLIATLPLAPKAMPQDIKIAPDGAVWYVADMASNGVWLINGATFAKVGFLPTGKGAHGLYPRRDAKILYITNRDEGSISLLSFATRKIVGRWQLPAGGSPDMGGLNAAGTVLWLSGRYNSVVYAINTTNGRLIATIAVGNGPHGLCVYPQPGRYSLGHTGILR